MYLELSKPSRNYFLQTNSWFTRLSAMQSILLQQSLPPMSTYWSRSNSIKVRSAMKTKDLSEKRHQGTRHWSLWVIVLIGWQWRHKSVQKQQRYLQLRRITTPSQLIDKNSTRLLVFLLRFRFLLRLLRFLLFLLVRKTLGTLSVFYLDCYLAYRAYLALFCPRRQSSRLQWPECQRLLFLCGTSRDCDLAIDRTRCHDGTRDRVSSTNISNFYRCFIQQQMLLWLWYQSPRYHLSRNFRLLIQTTRAVEIILKIEMNFIKNLTSIKLSGIVIRANIAECVDAF